MNINFSELKKQQISNKILLNIIEVLYREIKTEKYQNVIINEFVDGMVQEEGEYDVYSFELKNTPISTVDILIVSEDGSIIVTPSSITKLEDNKVYIKSLQVKKGYNFYVTYKY